MTDERSQPDAAASETATAPAPDTTPAESAATMPSGTNKAFWAGVGIGSAALVAALMYTKRAKKRR